MPHLKCAACMGRIRSSQRPEDMAGGPCPRCGERLQPVALLAELVGFQSLTRGPASSPAAGAGGGVRVVADADAGNIGQQVFQRLKSVIRCVMALTAGRRLLIAIRANGSIINSRAQHVRKFQLAVRLGQQQHAGIQPPVMHDRILGVTRREQHLE